MNIPPLPLLTMQLQLQAAGIMRDDFPGAFHAGAFCPFWSPHGSKKSNRKDVNREENEFQRKQNSMKTKEEAEAKIMAHLTEFP